MVFWGGRRVLITGHTGFKGSWLSEMLIQRGAMVAGLSLPPDTRPSLFEQLGLARRVDHALGDIRDADLVAARVAKVQPEILFHMAAQPLVRRSYRDPLHTWATNVMGTIHVLEAIRSLDSPCAVVVVTTDKVYMNREWEHTYREIDPLGGRDPYSASKACAELAAASYREAFFSGRLVRLATARAGNVLGGGDWSEDRIMPDLARAFGAGKRLLVRNSRSVRPWQHVLDPLRGYLMLAERLAGPDGTRFEDGFNFGPEPADQRSVGALVEAVRVHWEGEWNDQTNLAAPHEAGLLSLSIERARQMLGWAPRWEFARAVAETARWYREVASGADPAELVRSQIAEFGA